MADVLTFNPPIIAHRGASAYAPENTIEAFAYAKKLGVRWIEFDVVQAGCGEAIVFHDETLDRTTNGAGLVYKTPYNHIRQLDAGSWFDKKYRHSYVPNLNEVLIFLQQNNLYANLEIKSLPGQEKIHIDHILNVVKPYLSSMVILFSSFSIQSLTYLRSVFPAAQIGLLLHEWLPDWEKVSMELATVSIHVNEAIMTGERARLIKTLKKKLLCYTVNSLERARQLYQYGVDAVFTDVPDRILEAIPK